MAKYVFEIFEEASKKKKKEEKIKFLKSNMNWAVKDIIRGSLDSTVIWNLPGGSPPYTESEPHNAPSNLVREYKQFVWFVKGAKGDKLPAFKREAIFIGLLEGVHPEDAKLVVNMINKKPPKGITRSLIQEAFPGLLKD